MIESETGLEILALVLVSIGSVIVLFRRLGPQLRRRIQLADYLQHQGLLSLTPQCSVALVRVGQETLVLGVTPHAVTLLTKTHEVWGQEEREEGRTPTEQRQSTEIRDFLFTEKLEVEI